MKKYGLLKINSKTRRSVALLTPALICIAIISLFPVIRGITLGFTDYKVAMPIKFNGFRNYATIYKSGFLKVAIKNTVLVTLISLATTYIISLFAALLLNSRIPFRRLWRTLLVIPWAVPGVAKVGTWRSIFTTNGGWINFYLLKFGLIKENINWIGNPNIALYTIITIIVWGCIPFAAMSFLAAMQTIPEENYEAAEIDGANFFQKFWYITFPHLRSISMVTVSLLFMWITNDFTSQYSLTNGGPGSATLTMSVEAFFQGFRSGNFGQATAYGNVMIIFCGIFLFFYIRALQQKG